MMKRNPCVSVCAAAAVLILPLTTVHADRSPAQSTAASVKRKPPVVNVNRFSADVSIQRGFLDQEGRPIGAKLPPIRYRWERVREGGRWKTVMNLTSATRPPAVTFRGKLQPFPPAISRIEEDGDGTPPRIYARDGTLLRLPDASTRKPLDLSLLPGRTELQSPVPLLKDAPHAVADDGSWIEAMLPSAARTAERRTALQRRFGSALGTVRGLSRFVTTAGDLTTEVLVDPQMAVPIEVNIARNGELESHAAYTYAAIAGGGLVRQRMHSEQRLTGSQAGRLSVDIDIANVKVGQGR
jgi:hypothetical protein